MVGVHVCEPEHIPAKGDWKKEGRLYSPKVVLGIPELVRHHPRTRKSTFVSVPHETPRQHCHFERNLRIPLSSFLLYWGRSVRFCGRLLLASLTCRHLHVLVVVLPSSEPRPDLSRPTFPFRECLSGPSTYLLYKGDNCHIFTIIKDKYKSHPYGQ